MYLPSALSICSLKRNLIFQVEKKKCKAIYAYLYTLGKIVPRTFSEAIINSFSKYFEEKNESKQKKKNSIFVFCSPTGSQLQVILLPRGCFATRDIFVYHSSGWRRGALLASSGSRDWRECHSFTIHRAILSNSELSVSEGY